MRNGVKFLGLSSHRFFFLDDSEGGFTVLNRQFSKSKVTVTCFYIFVVTILLALFVKNLLLPSLPPTNST